MPGRGSRRLFGCVAAAALATFCYDLDTDTISWSLAQIARACVFAPLDDAVAPAIDALESRAWASWEARRLSELRPPMAVPEHTLNQTFIVPDLSRPFVVRCLLCGSAALGSDAGDTRTSFTAWLSEAPVGDVFVDYHANASAAALGDALVPRARAKLRDVVADIERGGSAKLASELIFRAHPELLERLSLTERLAPLFGDAIGAFSPHRLGRTLTVPVFMAKGQPGARTDLHSEPIANAVLMLRGLKRWTLVPPEESHVLRPALSPDGRAYFASAVAPEAAAAHLGRVRRYELEVRAGDFLWVPTWYWHRVDYVDNVTALSVSLFHVRARQLLGSAPLLATLMFPNLLKELVGWKTQ